MPNWLFAPLTDAPTRVAKKISSTMDPYEPMQQTGQGGLHDWLAWTDAAAKGLLQGSTEAAGGMLSDMTSPFSIGMQAVGAGGLKKLAGLTRLGRNAAKIAPAAEETAAAAGKLGAEFAPVGSEAAVNTARAANVAKEAKDLKLAARRGAVNEHPITARNADALVESASTRKPLPQIEDAYVQGTPNAAGLNLGSRGTSVYKPEVAKEMSRMMVEMMDEGATKDAFRIAQQKYPRLMGHVQEVNIGPSPGSSIWKRLNTAGSSGGVAPGLQGSSSLSKVRVDPMSTMNWSAEGTADTIGHELAHVAQRLRKGNTQLGLKYDAAERALGYADNPMEVMARKSGKKFSKYALRDE